MRERFGPVTEHGTDRGWQQERRRGIEHCQPCVEAHRAYQRDYKLRRKTGQPALPRKPRARAGCGTYSGFQQHYRAGQEPCDPCLAARRAYQVTQVRAARAWKRIEKLMGAAA